MIYVLAETTAVWDYAYLRYLNVLVLYLLLAVVRDFTRLDLGYSYKKYLLLTKSNAKHGVYQPTPE